MNYRGWKKVGAVVTGFLLLLGLSCLLLYTNRHHFSPEVKAVDYLLARVDSNASIVAGIRIRNNAPVSFTLDSILYQVRYKDKVLGQGHQLALQQVAALETKTLAFDLLFDLERYQEQLRLQPEQEDSIGLDVYVQVYLDPPLLGQQVFRLNRSVSIAIPRPPALRIDSVAVSHFSPDSGYTLQLFLHTGNTRLPELQIENLHYQFRFADTLRLHGRSAATFRTEANSNRLVVPLRLETSEALKLLSLKLSDRQHWPYEATVTATLRSAQPLLEQTFIGITKTGVIDLSRSGNMPEPSVERLQRLQLLSQAEETYLQATLLIHNPTPIPLYIDSARYILRHRGQVIAGGAADYETIFPARQSRPFQLQLTVNNSAYNRFMDQAPAGSNLPLGAELLLHYRLKNGQSRLLRLQDTLQVQKPEGLSFKLTDIGVRQLSPEQGAQLFVKLETNNQGKQHIRIERLHYAVTVDGHIEITGQSKSPLAIGPGTSEMEIPVDLSADAVNQLAKGLIQGKEDWDYTFSGQAIVSAAGGLLQQTQVHVQTEGIFSIHSKGSPDYMPELSKIDTLYATIHYDTAWVRMYAAIYNTLPVTINISQLEVNAIHEQDTIARTVEKPAIALLPDTNTFAWHLLGINYGTWRDHVERHQHEDSMLLSFPATLTLALGSLDTQQVTLNLNTRIPTPATPVTLLKKVKLRGFGFRSGLRYLALVAVQNTNSEGLTVKDIDYQVYLENGVDFCGKINRSYRIPVGQSEVQVPVNLSVWESVKLLTRKWFGPPLLDYKLYATGLVRTDNPKLQDVYIIFENHSQSNLREKKTLPPAP